MASERKRATKISLVCHALYNAPPESRRHLPRKIITPPQGKGDTTIPRGCPLHESYNFNERAAPQDPRSHTCGASHPQRRGEAGGGGENPFATRKEHEKLPRHTTRPARGGVGGGGVKACLRRESTHLLEKADRRC